MSDILSDTYRNQLSALTGMIPSLDDVRTRAFKKFAETGFPSARSEDWRYSDLKTLRKNIFEQAAKPHSDATIPATICKTAARLVFTNGQYREDLSDLGDLWQAASIRPLANHLMANPDRASDLVHGNDGIAALNTALMRDGLVLNIPAGVEIDEPVEIINVMSGAAEAATHTRHLIELGEGAKLTVLERFIGDDSAYWVNTIMQARVTEGAVLKHIRLQEEGSNAVHTAKTFVSVGAEGRYDTCNISLGGLVARFEAHVRLLVDEATANIDGVALAATGQSHDMVAHVDHRMPNTTSDQIFRTVAEARGKTAFQGKIVVAKDAQKTIADQSFKALLLDRTAEANAKPELEIFADDVKCSHGATIGELDAKALFYLTSRGIDPVTARQMLVEAFTDHALLRIPGEDLGDAVRDRISAWMQARVNSATESAA
ncbi:Fe-S cluster assembly protein SufD [Kordiimonas aquimaris]|uniref:Fe-S cluster assembly protein SufD n=1 Tax=Kordiimonas aquimaris TaxID=707591 RepID=UPI0021D2B843|nr:Fe-S cluster assembly protein SufD [Kordiimonas aquimaris]